MKKHVLRTSDLAHRIGVQPEAIRYYEQRGLLPPPQRAASGYRIYTPEHLERVEFIKKCQTLGFSLDEIRELMELKFRGSSPCRHVRDLRIRVGIKENEPAIPICYCFGHTIDSVRAEIEATGQSTVARKSRKKFRPAIAPAR